MTCFAYSWVVGQTAQLPLVECPSTPYPLPLLPPFFLQYIFAALKGSRDDLYSTMRRRSTGAGGVGRRKSSAVEEHKIGVAKRTMTIQNFIDGRCNASD